MIRRPPRSTRTDTLFPERRSSDLGCALMAPPPVPARPHRPRPHAAPCRAGFPDRKSTRLNPVTNAHLVCRLLLEKKNLPTIVQRLTHISTKCTTFIRSTGEKIRTRDSSIHN